MLSFYLDSTNLPCSLGFWPSLVCAYLSCWADRWLAVAAARGEKPDIMGTAFYGAVGNGIEDVVDFGVEAAEVYPYRNLDGDASSGIDHRSV